MSAQEQMVDMNAVLYRMWEKITNLTTQLKEIQNTQNADTVERKFNKKVWIKANWDMFANDFEISATPQGIGLLGKKSKLKLKNISNPKLSMTGYVSKSVPSNKRMDDFVTQFLALSIQGGFGNEHIVDLLEHNVNPHIAEQLYL
ncbi:hypothetical protein SERLADRAFT_432085 [Serpula lacrymans var. lacrymans S7.9]|uniref:Uncharacterized protein n=1 Tax=Serpula lacrymans var. lacrymans (strain S7.9) TaxID=578457 RepID=F8NDY7_SERL9|nr:uncharacterized protein SERLADRAFT_432085 [Serpula lacrymans var. lacrymans S7.9]EGO30515.1 hypothetical protein SERLADRAFT_432085 [Serpula lacrymans var. lacrymans S7.9]